MVREAVEKAPGWVEKILFPYLDSRIRSIVKDEVDRVIKLEEKIVNIDNRLARIENIIRSLLP